MMIADLYLGAGSVSSIDRRRIAAVGYTFVAGEGPSIGPPFGHYHSLRIFDRHFDGERRSLPSLRQPLLGRAS